jgi:hypothetical protein
MRKWKMSRANKCKGRTQCGFNQQLMCMHPLRWSHGVLFIGQFGGGGSVYIIRPAPNHPGSHMGSLQSFMIYNYFYVGPIPSWHVSRVESPPVSRLRHREDFGAASVVTWHSSFCPVYAFVSDVSWPWPSSLIVAPPSCKMHRWKPRWSNRVILPKP